MGGQQKIENGGLGLENIVQHQVQSDLFGEEVDAHRVFVSVSPQFDLSQHLEHKY